MLLEDSSVSFDPDQSRAVGSRCSVEGLEFLGRIVPLPIAWRFAVRLVGKNSPTAPSDTAEVS